MCEHCKASDWTRVADLGGMVLMRCDWCDHQQMFRKQEARGGAWRGGEFTPSVVVSGEIKDG